MADSDSYPSDLGRDDDTSNGMVLRVQDVMMTAYQVR